MITESAHDHPGAGRPVFADDSGMRRAVVAVTGVVVSAALLGSVAVVLSGIAAGVVFESTAAPVAERASTHVSGTGHHTARHTVGTHD